jgi:hypothetical protein
MMGLRSRWTVWYGKQTTGRMAIGPTPPSAFTAGFGIEFEPDWRDVVAPREALYELAADSRCLVCPNTGSTVCLRSW